MPEKRTNLFREEEAGIGADLVGGPLELTGDLEPRRELGRSGRDDLVGPELGLGLWREWRLFCRDLDKKAGRRSR